MATVTRYVIFCKPHGNVSRHMVESADTLDAAIKCAEDVQSEHFRRAGWEIECVTTTRTIVASDTGL